MYGTLLPEHLLCYTAKQSENSCHDERQSTAQESKAADREKALQVTEKLKERKFVSAAKKLEDGIEETITYMDFPYQHWTRIRTNNTMERINREMKRRTRAICAFPDGQSALMLVCARLRHVAGTQWGSKCHMSMNNLSELE